METGESTANVDDFEWCGGDVEYLTTHLECFIILSRISAATSHMETDSNNLEFEIGRACEERLCVINVYTEFG